MKDAAAGIALAADRYDSPEPVNIGSGREISIRALAESICRLCQFRGEIRWDHTKPDGQPRRCLETTKAEDFGFRSSTPFEQGLLETIAWYERFRKNVNPVRFGSVSGAEKP